MSCVGVLDGRGEPVNEEDLVVGGEDEVKELDKDSGVVFTNVGPSVVFASFFVASFSPEIVSEPESPKSSQRDHDPLPRGDWEVVTSGLVEEDVGLEDNGQQGPDSIDPGVFGGDDGEDVDEGSEGQDEDD